MSKHDEMATDSQAMAPAAAVVDLELLNPITGQLMNLADIKSVQEAVATLPFDIINTTGMEGIIDREVIVWGCFKRLKSAFPTTPEELALNPMADTFSLWVVSGMDDPERRFLAVAGGVVQDSWTNLEQAMPVRGTVRQESGGRYGRYYSFS